MIHGLHVCARARQHRGLSHRCDGRGATGDEPDFERLSGGTDPLDCIEPHRVEEYLRPLRRHFDGFQFYALFVNLGLDPRLESTIRGEFESLSRLSTGRALFLWPVPPKEPSTHDGFFLDPFPLVSVIANGPGNWPGVIVWSRASPPVFVPDRVFFRMMPHVLATAPEDRIVEALGVETRGLSLSPRADGRAQPTATTITAIGCGAGLGADVGTLSFNVVTWDASTGRWSVAFYSDPGDGRGFSQDSVAISSGRLRAPTC